MCPLISIYALYLARTLYAPGYPSDAAGYLQLVARHQKMAAFTWGGWIFIDILPLPIMIAMYIVLQWQNRALALLGSLIALWFTVLGVLLYRYGLRLAANSENAAITYEKTNLPPGTKDGFYGCIRQQKRISGKTLENPCGDYAEEFMATSFPTCTCIALWYGDNCTCFRLQ